MVPARIQGLCPRTPGIYRLEPRNCSRTAKQRSRIPPALPVPGPGTALGSHPCVALSSTRLSHDATDRIGGIASRCRKRGVRGAQGGIVLVSIATEPRYGPYCRDQPLSPLFWLRLRPEPIPGRSDSCGPAPPQRFEGDLFGLWEARTDLRYGPPAACVRVCPALGILGIPVVFDAAGGLPQLRSHN